MAEPRSWPDEMDFHEIFSRGVPTYTCDERTSSPANASPYVMTRAQLDAVLEDDPWRLQLLDRVDTVFAGLEAVNVRVPAFLIGGGFVRRLKDSSKPRDIDGLAFYTIAGDAIGRAVDALAASKLKAKAMNIDVRFCPLDTDPILMIKSIVFYSMLFSKVAGGMKIENGFILYQRYPALSG